MLSRRGLGLSSKDFVKTADTMSESVGGDGLLAENSSNAKQASRPMVRLSNTSPPDSKLKTPDRTTLSPQCV